MARTRTIQNSLITGVISPTLKGRIDLKKYYSAVEEAENMVIMPHGGMERRSGLKYLTTVPVGSRLFSFEFNISQNYVFILYTTGFSVNLPDSGNSVATHTWSTPLTTTQLNEMDIIQSADTVIITHEDFIPRSIQRQGSDTSWLVSNVALVNIPKFDYVADNTPDYFSYGESLIFDIKVDEIVYISSDHIAGGIADWLYTAKNDVFNTDLSEINFAYSAATFTNDGTSNTVVVGTGHVVLNADGNDSNGIDDHAYRSKTDLGSVDLATVDYSDLDLFYDNGLWSGTLGIRPDVWGDTGGSHTDRGWPRTCTFHQGRLWFGGSKAKPTSVWGSVVGNYFDFDTGKNQVQADDAIFDILDTDQFNAIQNIVSSRNLQVLTAGGEFVNTEDVLTPTTSAWIRSTGYGSARIKPVTLDGSTFFMDRFRKTVRGFVYDWEDGGYTTPPISILAESIINNVQDLDIVRGSSISVSNLLYLVNGDGTVAVFNTMRDEDIAGWTKWTTTGNFKRVIVSVDTVTFIVERDGVEYLEILDASVFLDHAFTATSSDYVGVNETLFNNEIMVVADGVTQSTTNAEESAGWISYRAYADRTADVLYAGLNYTVKIKTLPVAFETQGEGNIVNSTTRITECKLNLFESRGVYLNGQLITNRKFGTPTDEVMELTTGIEGTYLLGYNKQQYVEITQVSPDPFTLLSVDLNVSY